MTVHHYIASNRPFSVGSFMINPLEIPSYKREYLQKMRLKNHKQLLFSSCDDDFDYEYSIGFQELDGYEEIKQHFNNPYVYQLGCSDTREGDVTLFAFLSQFLSAGDQVELFTCLDGTEGKQGEDSLDIVIDLNKLTFQNDLGNIQLQAKRHLPHLSELFRFRERQYVIVRK